MGVEKNKCGLAAWRILTEGWINSRLESKVEIAPPRIKLAGRG
jgi:hypothetical protein